MRVLFDNGTPRGVGAALSGHSVEECRARGWDTLKNGELLDAAEAVGFDVFVTTDRSQPSAAALDQARLRRDVSPKREARRRKASGRQNACPALSKLTPNARRRFRRIRRLHGRGVPLDLLPRAVRDVPQVVRLRRPARVLKVGPGYGTVALGVVHPLDPVAR